jgi:hypothetical protein
MKIQCLHGHLYDEANTRWYTHQNGKRYYKCRKCCIFRKKLAYCTNEEYRQKELKRVKNYQRRKKLELNNGGSLQQTSGLG